jgi:Flavin-binding monooxygenase-like
MSTADKYCVIGAGPAGLAVAKTFAQRGIPFDCLEKADDIGGLWNIATSSGIVYDSTHLVSSSWTTGYDDFPMPEFNYPEYPSHTLVMQYFRQYAEHFDVLRHIQFNAPVEHAHPTADGTWRVKVSGEASARVYKGVVVANGHHNVPRLPDFPGAFAGEIMHSSDYKSSRQIRDRRVLVVGAGNSACDIVRDAALGGCSKVAMSMRRGTWFVPKFLLGFPTGDAVYAIEALPLPRIVKRYLFQWSLWVLQGPPERYGLPKPLHSIDAAHPTMSDDIPRLSAHGRIAIKPDISHLDGRDVVFLDGSHDQYDLIVYATGFKLEIPFLENNMVFDAAGQSRLFLNVAHPDHETLFFAGLVQANGSIWRLADYQAQLIANAIVAADYVPSEAQAFRQRVARARPGLPKMTAVRSARHTLEANYYDYKKILFQEIKRFRFAGATTIEQTPPKVAHIREPLPIAAE